MGAVWTDGGEQGNKGTLAANNDVLHGAHFVIDPAPAVPAAARFTASSLLPAWLQVAPLRFKEEKH
jgi:hypothetical protein